MGKKPCTLLILEWAQQSNFVCETKSLEHFSMVINIYNLLIICHQDLVILYMMKNTAAKINSKPNLPLFYHFEHILSHPGELYVLIYKMKIVVRASNNLLYFEELYK